MWNGLGLVSHTLTIDTEQWELMGLWTYCEATDNFAENSWSKWWFCPSLILQPYIFNRNEMYLAVTLVWIKSTCFYGKPHLNRLKKATGSTNQWISLQTGKHSIHKFKGISISSWDLFISFHKFLLLHLFSQHNFCTCKNTK